MPKIDPTQWLAKVSEYRPQTEGLTAWFSGEVAPARVGWYERFFTDSTVLAADLSMQYWDGQSWLTADGRRHWRQVGDYPAWRGLTRELRKGQEIVLLRGSRGRTNGPGCERRVRALLISATPHNVAAELLQDDPLATVAPQKTGERGIWHGLSFVGCGTGLWLVSSSAPD